MNELMKKENGMITSLELLDQINIFRKQKNRKNLAHSDLLKIIRDEFEEEIHEGKISCMFYMSKIGNGAERKSPYYNLTLSQAKQVLVRESKFVRKAVIHYIEELESKLAKKQLPTTYLEALKELVAQQEALLEANTTIEKQEKEITHKSNVIDGLTKDIPLKDQRQILNQVVRYKGSNFQERWRMLYSEFEKKYHMNLNYRYNDYNKNNTPKMKNKVDYIEKILKQLPELYDVATKIFEGDINEIIKNYIEIR